MRRKDTEYTIKAAYKRAISGAVSKKIDGDAYLDKAINQMLTNLIGEPGKSAGKAALAQSQTSSIGARENYTSAQVDGIDGIGASAFNQAAGVGLLNFALNQVTAAQAYARQNAFYDAHMSMPAKVKEYQDAGLNPMALAGAGVGATSAPSVAPAEGANIDMTGILQSLLNYKVQSKAVDADIDYKKAQTTAQELENNYIARRRENEIAISRETYRKLTADADTAEITAIWAPEMLESEFRNREADTALKSANKTLTEEKVKEVEQAVKQAEERFPEEIKNLKQNYAQMAALTFMYKTAAQNNVQELENLKQQFANLEEQNREIKNRADLHQTEIDTFMARNSKVTEGSDGMIIVTAPDGTITRFDALGIKKTTRHTMDGKVVKK